MGLNANANTITFDTGAMALGGQTVNAEAVVQTLNGKLSITLRNLVTDPTSVIQNISGFQVVLSSGQTTASLLSSSGQERTVNSNKTYSNGAVVSTGWVTGVLPGISVDGLGAPSTPAHTIIGAPVVASNKYNSANGSIKGNGPHNPFLAGDVTFLLAVNGLTAADSAISATFQFGTAAGNNITVRHHNVPDGGVSVLLLGMALTGLGLIRSKLS